MCCLHYNWLPLRLFNLLNIEIVHNIKAKTQMKEKIQKLQTYRPIDKPHDRRQTYEEFLSRPMKNFNLPIKSF